MILADWTNGHHVDLESEELQIVIHEGQEYAGNDHVEERKIPNPVPEYDDCKSVDDDFDVMEQAYFSIINSVIHVKYSHLSMR